MEDYIREARMVMLSFFVNEPKIKHRASQIIENKTATTLSQLGNVMSMNEARTRTIDAYFEMGLRYFKRYAAKEWRIFLTPTSKQKYDNVIAESALLDEVIHQLQETPSIRDDRARMMELGQYLVMKVRLERAELAIENEMLNLIEGPYFKDHVLPDVVRYFYHTYQNSKTIPTE